MHGIKLNSWTTMKNSSVSSLILYVCVVSYWVIYLHIAVFLLPYILSFLEIMMMFKNFILEWNWNIHDFFPFNLNTSSIEIFCSRYLYSRKMLFTKSLYCKLQVILRKLNKKPTHTAWNNIDLICMKYIKRLSIWKITEYLLSI